MRSANALTDHAAAWKRQHALSETELVIALVGAVGTDLHRVSEEVGLALDEFAYKGVTIGLSDLLRELAWDQPLVDKPLDAHIATYMDAGDELRTRWERADAMAMLACQRIMEHREQLKTQRRAYILRSLKTPAEVRTLREVYGSRFILIGVYTPDDERAQLLASRIGKDRGTKKRERWEHTPEMLMARDESEPGQYGQDVRDTFHRSDCFVHAGEGGALAADLRRLLRVFFGHPFTTPTRAEFAMCEASGAARLSSEPGRQVGAALASVSGDIIALGTNEVPRPGGGFYHADDDTSKIADKREFNFRVGNRRSKIDTNNLIQQQIAGEVVKALDGMLDEGAQPDEVLRRVLETRLGALTEFGRAVHAEMSALLDAARNGHAMQDATMYVTTFPCHSCARHLLGSGVRRVVYIAPYAKSMAAELHEGDIVVAHSAPPDSVLHLEPFVGVAPHRYLDLFGGLDRKGPDGTLTKWRADRALPRLFDAPSAELRQNQPAYRVREHMLARVVEECEDKSTLRLGASSSTRHTASSASARSRSSRPSSKSGTSRRRSTQS